MTTVTAAQLYSALRTAGYSPVQAVGIMANAANESGTPGNPLAAYNLDATGDNGCSHGLLQWNTCGGGYKSMAGQSLQTQIAYMGQTLPNNCMGMGNAADIAACLSASFEKCQGCQQGGAQYNQRVGNVAPLTAAAFYTGDSGAATPAGGGLTTGTGTGSGTPAQTTSAVSGSNPDCMISASGVSGLSAIPVIGNVIGGVLNTVTPCFVTFSNVRAWISPAIILTGAVLMVTGAVLIIKQTPVGQAATGVVKGTASGAGNVVAWFAAPEIEGAAAAGRTAGRRATRLAASTRTGRSAAAQGKARGSAARQQQRLGQGERRAATGERRAATAEREADTDRYRSRSERSEKRATVTGRWTPSR